MAVTVGTNSYATEAELIAYAAARGITVTDGDETLLLIRAMDYIETLQYVGQRTVQTQPLQWPRYDATEYGLPIASDIVPERVKRAQCEAAIRATSAGGLIADQPAAIIQREKVGPLEVEYSPYTNTGATRYPYIMRLLQPVLAGAQGGLNHPAVRV